MGRGLGTPALGDMHAGIWRLGPLWGRRVMFLPGLRRKCFISVISDNCLGVDLWKNLSMFLMKTFLKRRTRVLRASVLVQIKLLLLINLILIS